MKVFSRTVLGLPIVAIVTGVAALTPLAALAQVGVGTGTGSTMGGATRVGGTPGSLGSTGTTGLGTGTGQFGTTGQLGTTAGRAGLGGTTGSGVPTANNPFQYFFANPMGAGLGSFSGSGSSYSTGTGTRTTSPASTKAFGQPLYAPASTTTAAAGTGSTLGGSFAGTGIGFSTMGVFKAIPYAGELSEEVPLILHPSQKIHDEVKQILDRSTSLKGKGAIQVEVTGNTVVLRGHIASDRHRRLAEAVIRMTPGVHEVRNQLHISEGGN